MAVPQHSVAPTRVAATVFMRLCGLGMLGLVFVTIINPRFATFDYSRGWALGVLVVLLGMVAAAHLPVVQDRMWRVRRARWDRLALPVGVLCCLVAAVVGHTTYYFTTWDSKLIELIAQDSPRVTTYYHDYMSRYPNNLLYLGFARLAVGVSRNTDLSFGGVFLLFNIVAFAVTLVGLYLVVRRVRGAGAAVAAMVLLTAIVGINPAMAIAYTDIPGLWTPIWAVWFFLRARDAANWATASGWAFGGAAILGFGYDLKTTPIVGVGAAAIWFIGVYLVRRRDPLRVVACLAMLVIGTSAGAMLTQSVAARLSPSLNLNPAIVTTPWQYVAAGVSIETDDGVVHYGGFSREVNSKTFNKPTAEQVEFSKNYIAERFEERGLSGMVAFEFDKASFTWGDGMLFAYGEGQDSKALPLVTGPGASVVTAWNSPSGSLWFQRIALAQAVWWLLLLLMARQWLVGRVTSDQLLFLLNVLAIGLFVQVFQGRARYLTGHIPIFVAIAMTFWPVFTRSATGVPGGRRARRRAAEDDRMVAPTPAG
ncbi:glycosyltransferase family 39 protein [Branchiibius sp. NY16-3462-2]|uniref:glycosyltransferase family 39 protein n=1 Tax=Branchiibius sp. NY16-3462-2 TaxID=1807500 RepID=UPI0025BC4298|nr:glycosyltransferase family 39 protein [Branchiibius sp. NY16-3462-2]